MLVRLDHFPRDRGENKKYLSCHHLVYPYTHNIFMFSNFVCQQRFLAASACLQWQGMLPSWHCSNKPPDACWPGIPRIFFIHAVMEISEIPPWSLNKALFPWGVGPLGSHNSSKFKSSLTKNVSVALKNIVGNKRWTSEIIWKPSWLEQKNIYIFVN